MKNKGADVLYGNLQEMRLVVDSISTDSKSSEGDPKRRRLYIGSLLYDYYLLAEKCLLQIARTFDRWAPTSLDWRLRLIKMMQDPVEDKRPAIISTETASTLMEFLMHYQNFSNQSSTTFATRINKLEAELERFQDRFEQEIGMFAKMLSR